MKKLEERNINFYAEDKEIVDRDMSVFYNPVMKLNRDVTSLVISTMENVKSCFPLAGSGIRALRIGRERENVESIYVNDIKESFEKLFEKNLDLNSLNKDKFIVGCKDANLFLLENKPFDYIDIDPYGSPNKFLDSAIHSLKHKGIIGITATDTAALAGTYEKACKRKYWAIPIRNELKHEMALRILIRKCQLIAAQYEKALIPVLSYFKDHYYKVFLKCIHKKSEADKVLLKHRYWNEKGPLWTGQLYEEETVKKALENCSEEWKESYKLIKTIYEELEVDVFGFIDLHAFSKEYKIEKVPANKEVVKAIEEKGFIARRTHISNKGIKTNMPFEEVKDVILQLS